MQPNAPSTSNESDTTWVPDGYVRLEGPGYKTYIVPEFMVPALDQDYHSNKKKDELKVVYAKGTVSLSFGPITTTLISIPNAITLNIRDFIFSGIYGVRHSWY
jgi:hypothetical protein